jgi:hypothetical protein
LPTTLSTSPPVVIVPDEVRSIPVPVVREFAVRVRPVVVDTPVLNPNVVATPVLPNVIVLAAAPVPKLIFCATASLPIEITPAEELSSNTPAASSSNVSEELSVISPVEVEVRAIPPVPEFNAREVEVVVFPIVIVFAIDVPISIAPVPELRVNAVAPVEFPIVIVLAVASVPITIFPVSLEPMVSVPLFTDERVPVPVIYSPGLSVTAVALTDAVGVPLFMFKTANLAEAVA